jgi:hypothetical protein
MIQGNQTWSQALAQPQKQPLYILEIPQYGILLASFASSLLAPVAGGYGVSLYGIAPYGT